MGMNNGATALNSNTSRALSSVVYYFGTSVNSGAISTVGSNGIFVPRVPCPSLAVNVPQSIERTSASVTDPAHLWVWGERLPYEVGYGACGDRTGKTDLVKKWANNGSVVSYFTTIRICLS
jgi:hypothetical protein